MVAYVETEINESQTTFTDRKTTGKENENIFEIIVVKQNYNHFLAIIFRIFGPVLLFLLQQELSLLNDFLVMR